MLFLPVGMPACGKSWLGGLYFAPNEIVCPDDIREWMTDDANDQTCNREVFQVVNKIVEQRMVRGLDTYLDATNLKPSLWPDYEDRLFIMFDTLPHICYDRNAARDRVVPDHAMKRMEQAYLNLLNIPPEPWVWMQDFDREENS